MGASAATTGMRRAATWALLLAAALLAGCQTPVRLMPTPVVFRNSDIDPFAQAGYTAPGTHVPVLFATNRGAVIEWPEPVLSLFPSNTLRMGVADVRIGDGTLDWETLHRLSTSDDPAERPIVQLDRLEQRAVLVPDTGPGNSPDLPAFLAVVNQAIAASPNTQLLVYVHGSNSTVQRAAAQAAQFRHFTGRRMVVLSLMWPSAGTLLRYFTDVHNAAASVEPFARLIELLAAKTQATSIDVLAYSAGAQVASPGLAMLGMGRAGESRAELRRRLRLGQIYFAAPDIDTRRFVDDLGQYIDLAERVSVAANLNDSVLRVAALVHRSSRAGRPNPTELDAEQSAFLIEASQRLDFDLLKVDPNDIPHLPPGSHAFWYDDPWVSGDLLGLLLLRAKPQQRGLVAQTTVGGTRFWTFPADFDQRVARLFAEARDSGEPPRAR
jgi:esterase/lipase superfamily enzyme